jgi:NADH:ubiquinone oxidoreductase subunit K
MLLNQFLLLSAFLFCTGIYGVLTRKHAVLVLMSIELMLAAVNINLVAFGAFHNTTADASAAVVGQVFALFVLTIAAAEVGVGLAIVLLIYRNLHSADLDDVDSLKG